MENKILLFIPMYNCEKQIIRVLDQLTPDVCKYLSEAIIVNNRSTDNGERAALEYLQKKQLPLPVKLLRNHENYGLGGSHKVAFLYALEHGFDYVIVLHGDDQGNIRDILPVLKKRAYEKYDCCLGARFMGKSRLQGYSAFRTFGNRVYNILFSLVCGYCVYDLGSGLNMYSAEMLRSGYYMKYPDNLMFNYCMVMAVRQYRQKALFFPISWREEDQISNVKLFDQARRVLGMLGRFALERGRFLKKELRTVPVDAYGADEIFRQAGTRE